MNEHMFAREGAPGKPSLRVGGILVSEGRLLMVQQQRGEDTYWMPPGGNVEFGETLAEALVREFSEEIGLAVDVGPFVAIIESLSPDPAYQKHVVHLLFVVSVNDSDAAAITKRAPAELDLRPLDEAIIDVRFVDGDFLAQADVRPPVNAFLIDCLSALPPGPQYLGRRW